MTKKDKTLQKNLSIEQENAIELLIQGKSDREVGEAVGVSRQTITNWRLNNPSFIVELNRKRKELWGSQEERLRNLVKKAVDILEQSLSSSDEKIRLSSAINVLKAVGLYGLNLTPKGFTNIEDLLAIQRLDESIKRLSELGYDSGNSFDDKVEVIVEK